MYGDPHESLVDVERIDLDPVYDGFSGVVVELTRKGDSYIVVQSAEVTGNRLLRFVTASEERALEFFEGEKGALADADQCVVGCYRLDGILVGVVVLVLFEEGAAAMVARNEHICLEQIFFVVGNYAVPPLVDRRVSRQQDGHLIRHDPQDQAPVVDRLPARVVGVVGIEVLARTHAVDVNAVKIFLPLPTRGRRLLYLALPVIFFYHRKVVVVGRVILRFLVAQAVPRFPDLVEDEPRVYEQLESADVVLMWVRERGTGQPPDISILVGVVLFRHQFFEVSDGIYRSVTVTVDVHNHEGVVGEPHSDAITPARCLCSGFQGSLNKDTEKSSDSSTALIDPGDDANAAHAGHEPEAHEK